jgi:RNA polymerase sigma-70 factor (ECF subfamily)
MNELLSTAAPPRAWPTEPLPAAVTAPADEEPTPPPPDEQQLTSLAMAGDLAAFNQLVARVQDGAYNVAYRMVHDEAAAADVVQESLIKAWRALPTYRGGRFKSWFLRILLNTCYDLLRSYKRQATVSLDDLTAAGELTFDVADRGERPDAYVERLELQQWLVRGIAALPPDQRVVVVLYDVEGYSYNEIVEITGDPMGTVKSRLNRGRIRLRDFLVRHGVVCG